MFERCPKPLQIAAASQYAEYQRYQLGRRAQSVPAYWEWFKLAPGDYRAAAGLFLMAALREAGVASWPRASAGSRPISRNTATRLGRDTFTLASGREVDPGDEPSGPLYHRDGL